MHGVPTVREQDMPLLIAITNTKIPVPLSVLLNGVLLNQLLLLHSILHHQRQLSLLPYLLQNVKPENTHTVSQYEPAVAIQPQIPTHGSTTLHVRNT